VIAETVRLRRDLPIVDTVTDLTRELALLTAHRSDLIADRVRMINRLRDVMTSVFPTLEQEFDYSSHKGALHRSHRSVAYAAHNQGGEGSATPPDR
jgi:Transposase